MSNDGERLRNRSDSSRQAKQGRRFLEIAAGIALLVALATPGPRFIISVWMTALGDGLRSFLALMRVDSAATVSTSLKAIARLILAALPALWLISTMRPRSRLWAVPPLLMLFIASTPLSLASCSTPSRWVILALVSAAAAALCRMRLLGWTVVLPFFVLWEVATTHGLLMFSDVGTSNPEYRQELLQRCSDNDGTRPWNLEADHLMPYQGVTPYRDNLVLLTGEGASDGGMRGRNGGRRIGSWWVKRDERGFAIDLPSEATGNLWQGCILDDTLWMGRANAITGVRRVQGEPRMHERILHIPLPAKDMDSGQASCSPERGAVYVPEAFAGGLWEANPASGRTQRHDIGGVMLLGNKRRKDGQVLLANTAQLLVFSPSEQKVVERVSAGLAILGIDVCSNDDSVAVADTTGRVRIFSVDSGGRYRFAWGVSIFAPRRVAYSTDCSKLAATSADDRRVFIIDTTSHKVTNVLNAGPALREIAATGPREFSFTDVCSLTTYKW